MPETTDRPADLTSPKRHLFLSPHYDDIALSAGGTVRLLADNGRTPETLIVFGSEPDPSRPLSSFARAMHDDWGFTASEVVARRQAEEVAASARLGASHRLLPFRDAIYRGNRYVSNDDLFGEPSCAEHDLPAMIVASLDLPAEPDRSTRLYAPLAIGRHVDHQLTHQAGAMLADRGWDVWFYEDVPYALKPQAAETRLAEITAARSIEPVARIPVDTAWDAKVDAILSYPSQLETIFLNYVGVGISRDEISAALQRYANSSGKGTLEERFWTMN